MTGLPITWLSWAFLFTLAVGFVALCVWGFALQRLVSALEARHPDWYWELRRRSRRSLHRLAVVTELQRTIYEGEPAPDSVAADPEVARLMARERSARSVFVPLALVAFLIYAVG